LVPAISLPLFSSSRSALFWVLRLYFPSSVVVCYLVGKAYPPTLFGRDDSIHFPIFLDWKTSFSLLGNFPNSALLFSELPFFFPPRSRRPHFLSANSPTNPRELYSLLNQLRGLFHLPPPPTPFFDHSGIQDGGQHREPCSFP